MFHITLNTFYHNENNHTLSPWLKAQLKQILSGLFLRNDNRINPFSIGKTIGINDPHCVGASMLSVALAHALLCETPMQARLHGEGTGQACGQCSQCHLLKAGNHPDFMTLIPESLDVNFLEGLKKTSTSTTKTKPSKHIKIESVRALEQQFILSSQRGGYKVVVIYPAESLGVVPANALLKTLEEPPNHTVFIVVSEVWGKVLPTLKSRCKTYTLNNPEHTLKIDWLQQNQLPYKHAQRWLELASGQVNTALSMAQDPLWLPLLKMMPHLLEGSRIDALYLAQGMSKSELKQIVYALSWWCYDILLIAVILNNTNNNINNTNKISTLNIPRFFSAYTEGLTQLALNLNLELMTEYINELNQLLIHIEHPLNVKLVCESLLLQYKGLFINK